ncbi:MAG: SURF1 family cytochrome oxidase biogenesis protein [Actinomycetota bacterium]
MYRFLLTRRWLTAGLVVLAAAVTMIALGLWQLRRADEVKSANRLVRARLAAGPVAIDEVLGSESDRATAVYRRVEAAGSYDVAAEIAVDNRSSEGRPGRHLLTPLVTPGGKALLVDRGWIPLDTEAEAARPPSGRVTVVGVLFPSERKGTFGPAIPATGRLTRVPRIDVARIGEQLAYPVYPLYARLVSQTPGQPGELPSPPGLPELSDGPHLSYAVQWFLFTAVAVAVFAALARKEARKRARIAASG